MTEGDRLICAFVEKPELHQQFAKWLLHVTVVPWFRLPDSSETIARGLAEALSTITSFEAVGDGEAQLGPHHDRPARWLAQPTPFMEIEQKVRTYLHKKRAWLVDETTKEKHDYHPHVTAQKDVGLGEGEAFLVDTIYVVEQKGEYKEVVAEVKL